MAFFTEGLRLRKLKALGSTKKVKGPRSRRPSHQKKPPLMVCGTGKGNNVTPRTVRIKRTAASQAFCLGCQPAAVRACPQSAFSGRWGRARLSPGPPSEVAVAARVEDCSLCPLRQSRGARSRRASSSGPCMLESGCEYSHGLHFAVAAGRGCVRFTLLSRVGPLAPSLLLRDSGVVCVAAPLSWSCSRGRWASPRHHQAPCARRHARGSGDSRTSRAKSHPHGVRGLNWPEKEGSRGTAYNARGAGD